LSEQENEEQKSEQQCKPNFRSRMTRIWARILLRSSKSAVPLSYNTPSH